MHFTYDTPFGLLRRTMSCVHHVDDVNTIACCRASLLDNLDDAFSVENGAKNFSGSIAACLQSVGQPMPLGRGTVSILEVGTIVEALRQHLGGTHGYALHCPRAAPSVGVVLQSKHNWIRQKLQWVRDL